MEVCKYCNMILSDDNWYKSLKRKRERICKECHKAKTSQWKHKNPEMAKQISRRANRVLKEKQPEYNKNWMKQNRAIQRIEMITAYGGKCNHCGISDPIILDIDHINNDGAKQRRDGIQSWRLVRFLKKNGWPKEEYQLLCKNCNWKKEMKRRCG